MFKVRFMKKSLKGFVSVLLVLSIMTSIPFLNLLVSTAEDSQPAAGSSGGEEAATGDQIYDSPRCGEMSPQATEGTAFVKGASRYSLFLPAQTPAFSAAGSAGACAPTF